MSHSHSSSTSCGHGCGCEADELAHSDQPTSAIQPTINGVALLHPGEQLALDELRERAYGELLRQHAVSLGLLSHPTTDIAPVLSESDRAAIEIMLDQEIEVPQATQEACERYYAAHPKRFVQGQKKHVRHILFAVTNGVDVRRLAERAEATLLELLDKKASPELFAQHAAAFSNCPSRDQGGDLGWLAPSDCAPEFANELFYRAENGTPTGLCPRLIHSRFGLHIVEVLQDEPGTLIPFDHAKKGIEMQLGLQARSNALRQYLTLLAGAANIVGIDLDAATTPLVQ